MFSSTDKNIGFVPHIYSIMAQEKVLMTYLGDVNPQITNILLKAIKNDGSEFKAHVTVKKKIYKIIVECLENIMRHSEVIEKRDNPSIFILGKDESSYYIITGNYVYKNKADVIQKNLDSINNMTPAQVKDYYSEILAQGQISEKGGAGLGVVDIAIKSGNKLVYEFIHVQENIYFYILKIQVNVK